MSKLLRHRWSLSRPPAGPFTINHASPQAAGLVLWLPWGGGDPGSHRHTDRVRGITFTEGGTPVWVANGERGWSMLFDDASLEYLQTENPAVTGYPFSMACWFYANDTAIDHTLMWVGQASTTTHHTSLIALGKVAGDPVRAFSHTYGGSSYTAETTSGFNVNTWYHACGVWAARDDRRVYIDGGSKGIDTGTVGVMSGHDRTAIGYSRDSSPRDPMSGRIADVRIYDRALTDAEAWQLYDPFTRWELYKPLRRLWQGLSPAAPPAGQPIHLRAITIPHMRQWQPRVAS